MNLEPLTRRHAVDRREISCAVATVRAQTIVESESERSVEAVLATENQVTVFDMRSFRIIDEVLLMRGAMFDEQHVLLDDHARFEGNDAVLGSLRSIRTDGQTMLGRLHFAIGDERADAIWNKVRQGHLRDVSIGYRSIEYVDIPPGQSRNVAGKTYTAGERTLRITTRFQVNEASVTPIGADRATKIRSGAGLIPNERSTMNQALREYLESVGLRHEASEAEAWEFFRSLNGEQAIRAVQLNSGSRGDATEAGPSASSDAAAPPAATAPPTGQRSEAETPAANGPAASASSAAVGDPPNDGGGTRSAAGGVTAPPASDPDLEARIRQAEIVRQQQIRSFASAETDPDWIEHCITRGLTIEQSEQFILRRERENRPAAVSGAPAHRIGGEDRNANERSLAAALANHCNGDGMEIMQRAGLTEQQAEEACTRGDRLVVTSAFDVLRAAVDMVGARDPETGAPPRTIEGYIRAGVSTLTVSNVFSTSINARIMQAFDSSEDTTGWCQYTDVNNFQTQERTAYGKMGGMKKLPRGGTAKHGTISDLQETFKIHRYAEQLVIDEQDFIDNNLDAFVSLPMELGDDAAQVRPDLVYSALLANAALGQDSVALFHASHNNTASDALAASAIRTALSAMRKQTQDGRNLNVRPVHLVLNTDLEWTARELMNSGQIIIAGDTDQERGNANVIRGTLNVVPEPRLTNGVTDPESGTAYSGSSTNWFVAAARRTIEVAHLAGTGRRPSIRRFLLDRGQWGLGWDVKFDVGVKPLAYQTLYRGNS